MKTKISLFVCLLFAIGALSATNQTEALVLFAKATHNTIAPVPVSAASCEMVFAAAGIHVKTGLIHPTEVAVVSRLPATVTSDCTYPEQAGIQSIQQTILSGGGFANSRTSRPLVTTNATVGGYVTQNSNELSIIN